MIRTHSQFLFALFAAASASFAQRTPIEQQLTFAPYHASGVYEVSESVGWTVTPGPAIALPVTGGQ